MSLLGLEKSYCRFALFSAFFASAVFAGDQGAIPLTRPCFFVGIQGGYGYQYFQNGSPGTNQFDATTITSVRTTKSNDGIAGRLMAGYAFNPYLAIEVGAAKYSDLDWTIVSTTQTGLQIPVKMEVPTYALDLLGRVSYNFNYFDIFAKGGVAYVHSDFKFSNGINTVETAYRPEVALGFTIPINQNLGIEATYSHIYSKGNIHLADHTPSLDAILIGLNWYV